MCGWWPWNQVICIEFPRVFQEVHVHKLRSFQVLAKNNISYWYTQINMNIFIWWSIWCMLFFFLLIWCMVTLVKVLSIKYFVLEETVEPYNLISQRNLLVDGVSFWDLSLQVLGSFMDVTLDVCLKSLKHPRPQKWMVGLLNMVRAKVVPFNLFGTCTQIPQEKCQWILLILLLQWKFRLWTWYTP